MKKKRGAYAHLLQRTGQSISRSKIGAFEREEVNNKFFRRNKNC